MKVNVVVKRGLNDGSILDLARHFKAAGHTLRFIEYMDVGHTNGWRLDDVVPAAEIVASIDGELPLEPVEASYRGEVAQRYRYRDGSGEVGVIASVTSRSAVTARGHGSRPTASSARASSPFAATTFAGSCVPAPRRRARGRRRRHLLVVKTGIPSSAPPRPSTCPRLKCPLSAASSASADSHVRMGLPCRRRVSQGYRHDRGRRCDRARYLPRGWRDFGVQLAIWFGFLLAYQVVRGIADRNPARAFENGLWVIEIERG